MTDCTPYVQAAFDKFAADAVAAATAPLQTTISSLNSELQADQNQVAGLTAQVASLEAEILALQSAPPQPAPPGMEFGAFNNVGGNDAANLAKLTGPAGLGTVKRRRSFFSGLPATWSAHPGSQDVAAGLASFASVKPPGGDAAGVAAGKYDAQITAFVQGIPAGTLLTMNHEPENDMAGDVFIAMITQFAKVTKAANPGVLVGYVAMEYQFTGTTTGNSGGLSYVATDWAKAAGLDWLAIDVYATYWSVGTAATVPLFGMTGFNRWYGWAQRQGLPLRVAELGIHSTCVDAKGTHVFTDSQRAGWLAYALNWLKSAGFASVSYWNSDAGTNPAGTMWSIAGGVASPLTAAAWRSLQ
jgi:hypothetical protein